MQTRINAFRTKSGGILCDFGEGPMLDGETLEQAAVRVYREWCGAPHGGKIEPDANPLVIVHG